MITDLGGRTVGTVVKDLDYLIYCSQGSACWAYSCYGRKVEDAISLRQAGAHLLIVAEVDFWDALVGHGMHAPQSIAGST